ncbi:hypothetical protein Aab01nite_53620 [Paractinoplanes abujensis]|uniref:Uncharacterized protein n=1 Tax=Paractinoplanes abujensis TaxID=882441 RepID=A0A7W7CRZ8_9ACTN|nr:hypothetical protein [Actinoplanes abujensis]MBB4693568.1 hypothetical protein [Actinoplanes abujensis]GID21772.1 hypothetical protein Aab01nite_53620 [Actinoplanes abujensis]
MTWPATSACRCGSGSSQAPALVHQDDDELYIIDAPLDVKMETEVVGSTTPGGSGAGDCRAQTGPESEHNEALFRTTILPLVTKAVNTAPEYADLRRVYMSRVAAQFFRDRNRTTTTAYSTLIDQGNADAWPSRRPWDPKQVWRRFVKSYTDGEFKAEIRTKRGNVVEVATYIYGGVDFTTIARTPMAADQFAGRRPDLPRVVSQADQQMTAEQGQNLVWLGGRAEPGPPPGTQARASGPGRFRQVVVPLVGAVGALIVVGVGVAVAVLVFGKRPRRRSR